MIVLASSSPRRKELLKQISDDFIVEVSNIDESIDRPQKVEDIPYELAYRKAKAVSKTHYNDIVIGCDTIVAFDNEVLEKPLDEDDAYRMLSKLNNNTHKVISGVAIIYQDKEIRFIEESLVTFNNLSNEDINFYISTKDPLDKAGAYGIQELPDGFIKNIEGDLENIIGISSKSFEELLKEFQ